MNWVVVGFEVIVIIISLILIPIGWKIAKAINRNTEIAKTGNTILANVLEKIVTVVDHLAEARDRDFELDKRMSHIQRSVDNDLIKRIEKVEQRVKNI